MFSTNGNNLGIATALGGFLLRILEQIGKFGKGRQKFCKSIHTIDKTEGYPILMNDEKRKIKPIGTSKSL